MKYLTLISEDDASILREFAAQVGIEGACLEIGSAQGASATAILSALPPTRSLICSSYHDTEDYRLFREHCLEDGVWNRVIPVTGDFKGLKAHANIDPLAFVFLDHDHTKQGMEDFGKLIMPSCVSGSLMLFHDYNNPGYPAVKPWVDALDPSVFLKVRVTESMAVLRKL